MGVRSRVSRLFVLPGLVAIAGCAAPVQVAPPEWHPANASAPIRPLDSQPGALAVADPVEAAEEGVVPSSGATGMQADHADGAHGAEGAAADSVATLYRCPMHPEVTSDTPGKCPKCGMRLVKVKAGGEK